MRFPEVSWTDIEMLLKSPGESRVIMESGPQRDLRDTSRLMDQIQGGVLESFSRDVLVDRLTGDGLKYPMKMEG